MYSLGIEMIIHADRPAGTTGAAADGDHGSKSTSTTDAASATSPPLPSPASKEEEEHEHEEPAWLDLERASKGVLHALLSNRSLAYFKQNDFAAATADAERCCAAAPGFAKGHLRLVAALEGGEEHTKAPLKERRAAVVRGMRACPNNPALETAMDKLVVEAGPLNAQFLAEDALHLKEQMEETRRIANDVTDKRHAIAAGDLGSAYAVGAHGVEQDVVEAERYLKMGAAAGDPASSRQLGLLLLELERPEEAAEALKVAAELGDQEAAVSLRKLAIEADKKQEQLMGQLKARASAGDPRARAMLQQFGIMSVDGAY